jgi:hypothetical protein
MPSVEIEMNRRPSTWTKIAWFARRAFQAFREGWEWGKIYEHHRKAGHANPRLATELEIYYRGEYIERFRDEASEAYLRDGTSLDEVKASFIKDRLSTKTTILDTATTANLRAVIRDMPIQDAYHKDTFDLYVRDQQKKMREIMAEAEATFGKGGYTPLERRVLRGGT